MIGVDKHCTRLSETTSVAMSSVHSKRNSLEHFCCLGNNSCTFVASLAETVSFKCVILFWFCQILQDLRQVAKWLLNVREIPFSRPNIPKSTHPFLYMLKVAIFPFFQGTSAIRSCIELHKNKLEWDAAPPMRIKRKCCRNVEKGHWARENAN